MLSYELGPSSRFGLIGPTKQREKKAFLWGLGFDRAYRCSILNVHRTGKKNPLPESAYKPGLGSLFTNKAIDATEGSESFSKTDLQR